MEVSEVRVRLVQDANERLRAVCTVTLNGEFVVRDVKVVEGTHGLFVAMPSRKLSVPCPKCRSQNHLRARYCNECGHKLPPARIPSDENGREKTHRDVAHPITASFREVLQDRVLEAYRAECEQAEESGEAVSEYDALIADLKDGGERNRPGRGDDTSRDHTSGRRRRGRRHDRPDPNRAREESPKADVQRHIDETSSPRQPDSPVADAGEPAGGSPLEEDAEKEGSEAVLSSKALREEDRMNPPVMAPAEKGEPGKDEQVNAREDAQKPPDSDDAHDDNAPFGAGIL